jgi:hypothetical protein
MGLSRASNWVVEDRLVDQDDRAAGERYVAVPCRSSHGNSIWSFRYCIEISDWGRVAPNPTSKWQCYLTHPVLFFFIWNVRKWQWKRKEKKENWRILINKEIHASVQKPTITETVRLNRLCWFGHVQSMEENRIPKQVLCMNLGTTRLRGRPRNRWQDEGRDDGWIVGGEGWQGKVHNGEEWKKLLRTAGNRCILHMPMEWMNGTYAFIRRLIHT